MSTDVAPISERIGKAKPAAVTYRKGKDIGKGVRKRSRGEIMIFLSDTVFLSVPISVRTSLNTYPIPQMLYAMDLSVVIDYNLKFQTQPLASPAKA